MTHRAGRARSDRAPDRRRIGSATRLVVLSGVLAMPPALLAQADCVGAGPIRIDHVVVAVRSLESSAADYEALGFTLKPGRLHPNGLLNRHAEFPDGTEIELMSVVGPPGDEIARAYAAFLDEKEGGAYVALRGRADWVVPRAERAGLAPRVLEAGGFRYVTFAAPGLAAVFVIDYAGSPPEVTTHANGAAGIAEVRLEGGARVSHLLEALDATACGGPEDDPGTAVWALAVGRIAVLEAPAGARPRVRAVVLRSTARGGVIPAQRASGIRIELAPGDSG